MSLAADRQQELSINSEPNHVSSSGVPAPRRLTRGLILLPIFGLLAALTLIEVGFRVTQPWLIHRGHVSHRPDVYYFPASASDPSGFPSTAEKKPGAFRVMAIGDSFTFGPKLQVYDAWPARLEQLLKLNDSSRNVEVINAGVPGYSTYHEVTVLKHMLEYEPDLLLLQITLNDPEIEPYRNTHRDACLLRGRCAGYLSFFQSLNYVFKKLQYSASHREYERYYFNLFENAKTWDPFSKSLNTIKNLAAQRNVPLVAVVFPLFSHRIDKSYLFHALHTKLQAALAEKGIPFMDLLSAYRLIPPEQLEIEPGHDSHPNEIAHRIAAEQIYRRLENLQLIPQEFVIAQLSNSRDGLAQDPFHSHEK